MMDVKEMMELRMSGATFQEIADIAGVSRQNVHERLKLYSKKLLGIRGRGFNIDSIIYEGVYEHFKSNIDESLTSFIHKAFGENSRARPVTIKNFLSGKNESRFNINQIKRMCDIVGKPFEETFKERDRL